MTRRQPGGGEGDRDAKVRGELGSIALEGGGDVNGDEMSEMSSAKCVAMLRSSDYGRAVITGSAVGMML